MTCFNLRHSVTIALLLVGSCFMALVKAQTCAEPAGSQFRVVTLVAPGSTSGLTEGGNAGCVGMSIAPDGNIFIAKMQSGQIQVYDPAITGHTTLAGTIPTYFGTEDGLLGVAVDPTYATSHWIYAFYSDPCGQNCANRAMELARFTYDATQPAGSRLTNKKVILRFPREKNDNHHAAGNMSFTPGGVLVIGVGDNTNPADANNGGYGPIYYPTVNADAQRTSANTNDLRGKILRIQPLPFSDVRTPTPGPDSTYSIPAGNLWEKINNTTFNPHWDITDDITKVRKEIYTFGHRNPFHPRVDARSGWIFWGEVGPDARAYNATRGPFGRDEWNLATGPGFYGHPYCNGYNVPYGSLVSPSTTYGNKYDCLDTAVSNSTQTVPMKNVSPNNTGIHNMPPAIPAMVAYGTCTASAAACNPDGHIDDARFSTTYSTTATPSYNSSSAIGGPMYRYDPASASTIKFPPYYEGKIFFFDWPRRTFRVIKLLPDGRLPGLDTGVVNFAPSGFTTASYLDMQFGPDGALYALRNTNSGYSGGDGGLYRIEYTGGYDNTCYRTFDVTVPGPGATQGMTAIFNGSTLHKLVSPVMAGGLLILPPGYSTVELYNMSGRKVWSYHRDNADGSFSIRLPANLAKGILRANFGGEK